MKANPRVFGGALVNVHVVATEQIKKIVSANPEMMLQFKENQLMLCYTGKVADINVGFKYKLIIQVSTCP